LSQATEVVQGAGGVVWRRTADGGIEVLLVHRPKYDDWSLPKGKLDRGESHEAAALREVEEETTLRCRLGDELRSAHYIDHRGRPKTVRYWAMRPEGRPADGGTDWFTPNKEIDVLRWVRREEVGDVLSYGHDLEVVDSLSV
jgi:8-oxo-dGTP diphosphatase